MQLQQIEGQDGMTTVMRAGGCTGPKASRGPLGWSQGSRELTMPQTFAVALKDPFPIKDPLAPGQVLTGGQLGL